eukprot:1106391-Rhodomonas_salina.1
MKRESVVFASCPPHTLAQCALAQYTVAQYRTSHSIIRWLSPAPYACSVPDHSTLAQYRTSHRTARRPSTGCPCPYGSPASLRLSSAGAHANTALAAWAIR